MLVTLVLPLALSKRDFSLPQLRPSDGIFDASDEKGDIFRCSLRLARFSTGITCQS
jgi:hypothetical protein